MKVKLGRRTVAWTRGEYFDLWNNFLETMRREISTLGGVSNVTIQEENSEPFHHLWMGSINEPHTRHLVLNIAVVGEFRDEVEFRLIPECIFCAYAAIPVKLTSSDPIIQRILNMAGRFDLNTDNINAQLFSRTQSFLAPTDFPSGYPAPLPSSSPSQSIYGDANLLTTEAVWEAITICMNLRGDLGKITTDFGCSPLEILGYMGDHISSRSIPISFFRDLHGFATQLDKDPFYLLRSGKANDLLETEH